MDEREGARSDTNVVGMPTRLVWEKVPVDGKPATFGRGGSGDPVVFLHGWAIGAAAYRSALRELIRRGKTVIAPALPGFGGTADLAPGERSLAGYAGWVARFLDALGLSDRALVMGHSFGGGVAIALAHDHPERVSGLVLVNSIGGSAWAKTKSTVRSMAERPIWEWGIHFTADLLPVRNVRRVLPVVISESVPNLLRSPGSFLKVADVARKADLSAELEELKARGLPVVVLWGNRDRIITRASVDAICDALGDNGALVVAGGHAWILADPRGFGEVMTNVVDVVLRAKALSARPQTPEDELSRRQEGRFTKGQAEAG